MKYVFIALCLAMVSSMMFRSFDDSNTDHIKSNGRTISQSAPVSESE
ncbi:MAG: hypothetical protein FWD15_00995 [Alphaproteobacteria bacterium]|nr:hypothetical protein [Alphaproteobacteria bacterium]